MRWYLFQGLIVFLVVSTNIYWQWTPSQLLASVIGIAVAFLATTALQSALESRRRKRAEQQADR